MGRLIAWLLISILPLVAGPAWAVCPTTPTDCLAMPIYQTVTGWNGLLGGPWTTATRPVAPVPGLTGWNSTIASLETWNGSSWVAGGGSLFLPLSGGTVTGASTFSAGLTVGGSFTAPSLVTNADLVNPSLTLGNVLLTLGSTTTTIGNLTLTSPAITGSIFGSPAFVGVPSFNLGTVTPSAVYDATACTSNGCPGTGTACVWDGAVTHDVEPCVAAAYAAAVGSGGHNSEVDLPSQVLYFGEVFTVTSSFKLKGRGPGTIIRAMPSNVSSPILYSLVNASNVTTEDVTFDGGAATFAGSISGSTLTVDPVASFTGSISGTTLTTGTVTGGPIVVGMTLPNIAFPQLYIVANIDSTHWTLDHSPGNGTIASEAMTATVQGAPGAPIQIGDTLYWSTGTNDTITAGSGTTWTLSTTHGTVAAQVMFAAPATINPITQIFQTNGTKFNRVTWQNTTGIALNGTKVNGVDVTHSIQNNIGNRWKATQVNTDRWQGLTVNNGDGVLWGFNNTVPDSSFTDMGLAPVISYGPTGLVIDGNYMQINNGQGNLDPPPGFNGFAGGISVNQQVLSNGVAVRPTGVVLSNNIIMGSTGNCIDVQGLTNSTISGNNLSYCGGAGIGLFTAAFVAKVTAAISGTTMTISAISSGQVFASMTVDAPGAATAILGGTYITNFGTCAGASPTLPCTLTINKSQTVSSEAMDLGFNPQGVDIVGNYIANNVQVSSISVGAGVPAGISISGGNPDTINVSGNTVTDTQAVPTQLYGVSLNSLSSAGGLWTINPYHVSITGNNLNGNVTGPIQDASTSLFKTISNNGGVDDVIPAVASAATLVLPLNPTVSITGSTGVTSMAGTICWIGRQITMQSASGANPAFTAGGNIANSATLAANGFLVASCDASGNWHLH